MLVTKYRSLTSTLTAWRSRAAMFLIASVAIAHSAHAQSYQVVADFGDSEGREPHGALTMANDGNLYGTTVSGGLSHGTLFKMDPAGQFTTVHAFRLSDGAYPVAGLVEANNGKLYGVTKLGGAAGKGTVFRFDPLTNTLTTLVSFSGSNGAQPMGALAEGPDGFLYGTTSVGGSANFGTLFKVGVTGGLTTIHHFRGADGKLPYSGLVRGPDGRMYGTTFYGGGPGDYGTIFAVGAAGNFTSLFQFNYTNGSYPWGTLIRGSDGYLYGTAYSGGASGGGTVFRVTTGGALTTLRAFSYSGGGPVNPRGGLIQGSDGKFYGTSYMGGTLQKGTIYRIDAAGAVTVVRSLSSDDGVNPTSNLIQIAPGQLYGVMPTFGPPGSAGTVFEITTTGSFRVKHAFRGTPDAVRAPLTQATNGRLYGTSSSGGGSNLGTVFSLGLGGDVDVLGGFSSTNGAYPQSPVIQGRDGNFYGTALRGGSQNLGAVYKITPSGQFTLLASLTTATGYSPAARLFQAADGNFYGTALQGGASGAGTVFRITPTGALTVLKSFNWTNGRCPYGALVQGPDGRLYGTTLDGGTWERGTIFAITLSGAFTTLHSFSAGQGDGPYAEMTLGNDGRWYGTTVGGGASNLGTIYRFDPSTGSVTTLHSFNGTTTGKNPEAGLIQARDGAFYGATTWGGAYGKGTIFRYAPSTGATSVVLAFNGSNGATPRATLLQASDGNIYGATSEGGAVNNGVIFRFAPGSGGTILPPPPPPPPSNGSITVTAPNTSTQNWGIGATWPIKWNHTLGSGSSVKLEISRDGGGSWQNIAASVANTTATTGRYNWVVQGPATSQARIRVSSTDGTIRDVSDANFTIAAPFITVTSPNLSSDIWTVGVSKAITWTHNLGTLEQVKIELSKDGGVTFPVVLASGTGSDGSFSVKPLSTWVTALGRVRITWKRNTTIKDVSNVNFAIR